MSVHPSQLDPRPGLLKKRSAMAKIKYFHKTNNKFIATLLKSAVLATIFNVMRHKIKEPLGLTLINKEGHLNVAS